MTTDEKEIIKELFLKLKAVYYKQKVSDDFIERILRQLPPETIPFEDRIRIQEIDARITEGELNLIEQRINNL
nr:hypothetical protein [uncultured Flavobacterium sp.]